MVRVIEIFLVSGIYSFVALCSCTTRWAQVSGWYLLKGRYRQAKSEYLDDIVEINIRRFNQIPQEISDPKTTFQL